MSFLLKNNLLCEDQHGFLPKRSCFTDLLESIDLITNTLREGKTVDVIYTDFDKAFDKVCHAKLLQKLEAYGIKGKLLRWIESFLTVKTQRVVLGEHESEWAPVRNVVPQGSVLVPLLFLIYINDLKQTVQSQVKIFADDCKFSGRHIQINGFDKYLVDGIEF